MYKNTGLGATASGGFADNQSVLAAAWLNMMQAECQNLVLLSGLSLSQTDNTQLYQAVQRLISVAIANIASPFQPGSIISTDDPSFDPETIYGGSWEKYAQGMTLVGQLSGDALFGTLGAEVGEQTHTLTLDESAPHAHVYTTKSAQYPQSGGDTNCWSGTTDAETDTVGGGLPHNNVQPSKVVIFWRCVSL